jgi:hypothetical protein
MEQSAIGEALTVAAAPMIKAKSLLGINGLFEVSSG